MNLLELKKEVDNAIERVKEDGRKPEEIIVSLQIDDIDNPDSGYVCTDKDIECIYDNDCCASGFVISGWKQYEKQEGK